MSINIIGIDLAAKTENQTGMACILHRKVFLKTIYSNEDIINEIINCRPSVVAIDAPLSLPQGRCCLEKDCPCSSGGHFRKSDREMRKFGGVLPLTFPGMKTLTFRGIEIKKLINQIHGGSENFSRDFNSSKSDISKIAGIDIIETHPRTSQRVFGFSENINKFFRITNELFQLNNDLKDATVHEIDALFAAFSGLFYSQGKYLEVGNPEEGSIIVPKLDNKFRQDLIKIMKLN
ncbi:MAG TPA: DUF429 domain-containing protein [Methanobacteriaceae archaeon]|nr:DUF429 domain-containing protein [Methanobacteriaceae archaeon]